VKGLAIKGSRLPLVVAALLFAGANVAFFLTYRSGFAERRAALESRRDELQRNVEAAEKEAARIAGQKERLGGVSAAIDEFYGHRIGTERETLAPVVAEVHEILKEVGVSAPQISYTTMPMQKLPLSEMRIVFTVRCDYPRFKRLLREIETSPRWLAIRDVGITRDSERPGSVQVQLGVVTYFTEAGPTPAKPQEKAPQGARRRENAAAEARGARGADRPSEESPRRRG
jgi:Tfp pilus assembly protein PilO